MTGDIFIVPSVAATVLVVPNGGTAAHEVASTAAATPSWLSVQALADGKRLLLSRNAGDPEIVVVTIDGSEPERVIGRGGHPEFVEPDYLLALRGTQIVAGAQRSMRPSPPIRPCWPMGCSYELAST